MALLCTAGFVVLFRALRPPCLRGILLSAAIMGSMVQVKYTGLVFCVVWGMFLTVDLLRQCGWRVALRWSAAAGALLVATALPWYVYVYLGTGNPVLSLLAQLVSVSLLGRRLHAPASVRAEFQAGRRASRAWCRFPGLPRTYTQRFVEGYDGFLGFWVLALAPCWFLLAQGSHGVRAAPYWDMVIVGVAMIAGIVTYTPYVRYWMPAYPLLVASCVLAAGSFAALPRHGGRKDAGCSACWGIALVGRAAPAVRLLMPLPPMGRVCQTNSA